VPLFCLFLLSFNLNIHGSNIYRTGRCCCCRFLINSLRSLTCMKRKREISHWSRWCFLFPFRLYEYICICNIRRKKEKEIYRTIRKWMAISNVCFFLFSVCVFFIKDRNREQKQFLIPINWQISYCFFIAAVSWTSSRRCL